MLDSYTFNSSSRSREFSIEMHCSQAGSGFMSVKFSVQPVGSIRFGKRGRRMRVRIEIEIEIEKNKINNICIGTAAQN